MNNMNIEDFNNKRFYLFGSEWIINIVDNIEEWDDVEVKNTKKQTLILPKKKEIIV